MQPTSRDYSETPRRKLFLLGSGMSTAMEVFEVAAQQRSTSSAPPASIPSTWRRWQPSGAAR
jgi:hypothetical protein